MRVARLQTRIVVLFGLLMVAVQLLGLLLIHAVGVSNARGTIADELATGARMFDRVLQQRSLQLTQGARVLSADYAFREALTSHDNETIASALGNHGDRIQAQLMMYVGLDRTVVADSADRYAGQPFPVRALIVAAEEHGSTASLVVLAGQLYQVVVVPVAAPLPIGWVVMGFVIDDAAAKDLQRMTDLEVTFVSRAVNATWSLHATTLSARQKAAFEEPLRRESLENGENTLDGATYETRVSPQVVASGQYVAAVLMTSVEASLAPFRRLMEQLALVALGGILVSILCSILIARGIVEPVRQLAGFARRIARGDYSDPLRIDRADEIGDLSTAFDHMRDSIETREQQIMDLAYRDALTGLPNRALFSDRLGQAVAAARRTGAPLAILILDLDRFKYVNDTLGHPLGDALLKGVAGRLTAVMKRETDLVARLGGDEFAILLPSADVDDARKVAHAILRTLEEPLSLDGHIVDVHASIGIASFPEHGDDLDDLVRRADVAMYLAKRNNSGFAIYDIRYDEHTAARLSLMGELREAVEKDQLVVFYQPKISFVDPGQRCVEALVRWQHPRRGFIPPADFIPFAEQTGYIRHITLWMLEHVTAQCAAWHRVGLPINIAVNLSARDLLNPELPSAFGEMLARYRCEAGAVSLEITESAILEDTQRAIENLDRLSALGCRLAIDDYGTGYSSLSYLKKLPVDELKIDRSFVANMLDSHDDRVIVQSTIDLAHNMGMTVTAEGVEDDATFARLRAMGCDMAQGFHMSKPIPAAAVECWMRTSPWVTVSRAPALASA